jgi:hypothetical protein
MLARELSQQKRDRIRIDLCNGSQVSSTCLDCYNSNDFKLS